MTVTLPKTEIIRHGPARKLPRVSSAMTARDDQDDALAALSDVLNQITAKPYNVELHKLNIRTAEDAGLEDEAAAAREMLTVFLPATEDVWLPIIEKKEKEGDTMEAILEVLEYYKTAENDYLCACASHSPPVLDKP